MIERIKLIMENKEINNLEQTLIENLNVYRKLIRQIKSIQPKLGITNIFKRNICWIIGYFEYIKRDMGLFEYKIEWSKDTLRIFSSNLENEIVMITITLVRNRLFPEVFTNNIQIKAIGII